MSTTTTIPAKSKISEVTVFESSAQVRRVANFDKLEKGEVSICFSDLPETIDRDNVQVAVRHHGNDEDSKEGGKCTLRGVSFKTESIEIEDAAAAPSEERKALADRLQKLREDLQDANDKLDDAKSQGSFFAACADSALTGQRKEEDSSAVMSSPDKWKEMLGTTTEQDAAFLKEQRTLERRVKEITKLIGQAQSDLDSRGGSHRVSTKQVVVVVLLVTKELSNVDVRISYVVTQASWSAEYDVRFDPEKGEAKVTYNAVVKQHTTERWEDATLTISTARPTISGKPSELQPWRAKIYVAPPPRANLQLKSAARSSSAMSFSRGGGGGGGRGIANDELTECLQECSAPLEYDAEKIDLSGFTEPTIEEAKVKQGATSMSFHIDNHPYTVTNDSKPVRVTLAVVPVKADVTYLCRPKLTETVFARMKTTNMSEFTLLAGPALVFAGQQFVSKTAIERVSPGDSFTVNLGADNDVTVKYRRLKTERGESGSFISGKKVKHTLQTQITVKNRKRVSADITIEDQVPVSQHGDIEVTMVKPAPPEDDKSVAADKLRQGLVEFVFKLDAQGEKEIPIEFTVKHPEGFDMEGI